MKKIDSQKNEFTPLASRMRPKSFKEFFGQDNVVSKDKILRKIIDNDNLTSLIFWGPPGVGKTTLAKIIAEKTQCKFMEISAVMDGKDSLRKVVSKAKEYLSVGRKSILFIDEIHRWNKAQQDALLPYVEDGIISLIGATTENPSFEIIGALLSRSRVIILDKLSSNSIKLILKQALVDSKYGLGKFNIKIDNKALDILSELSCGDARVALNGLEIAFKSQYNNNLSIIKISSGDIKEAIQKTYLIFDKNGEEFYNLISALHKSMRGGDINASLYWLARMIEGGVDPLYVARRIVRFASEDIGMANSEALIQANAVYDACHRLGFPECSVHLAQAVLYCTKSKKSNLLYTAYTEAAKDAKYTSNLAVPLHLRNAPTKFMKDIGYGDGYKYSPDHNYTEEQNYLPQELNNKDYFKK